MAYEIKKYRGFFRSLRKGNYEESQRIHETFEGELERFLETREGEKFFRGISVNKKAHYLIICVFEKPFKR